MKMIGFFSFCSCVGCPNIHKSEIEESKELISSDISHSDKHRNVIETMSSCESEGSSNSSSKSDFPESTIQTEQEFNTYNEDQRPDSPVCSRRSTKFPALYLRKRHIETGKIRASKHEPFTSDLNVGYESCKQENTQEVNSSASNEIQDISSNESNIFASNIENKSWENETVGVKKQKYVCESLSSDSNY